MCSFVQNACSVSKIFEESFEFVIACDLHVCAMNRTRPWFRSS